MENLGTSPSDNKFIDEITKGVTEYKSISEKAINKHDEAIARHTNWWEKLTTNITYQGKFNQEILENLLTSANLVKGRDFFPQKKQTTYDVDENKQSYSVTERGIKALIASKFFVLISMQVFLNHKPLNMKIPAFHRIFF